MTAYFFLTMITKYNINNFFTLILTIINPRTHTTFIQKLFVMNFVSFLVIIVAIWNK